MGRRWAGVLARGPAEVWRWRAGGVPVARAAVRRSRVRRRRSFIIRRSVTVVRREIEVSASLAEVQALWFDHSRWASWVDGFGHLVEVRDPWPGDGGEIVWQSNPYGRGRVDERVVSFAVGEGQEAEVEDDRMTARQVVGFAAASGAVGAGGDGGATRVTLEFDYRIKRARPWMFLVDALFIRRVMGDSLGRTLEGFAREVDSPV